MLRLERGFNFACDVSKKKEKYNCRRPVILNGGISVANGGKNPSQKCACETKQRIRSDGLFSYQPRLEWSSCDNSFHVCQIDGDCILGYSSRKYTWKCAGVYPDVRIIRRPLCWETSTFV